MAGQGETPNTPRVGRMLGLGGSHPLQTPPTQDPSSSSSNRSLGSSWVELTPEANRQLVALSESTSDPVSDLNGHLPVLSAVTLAEFVEKCTNLIEGVNPRMHPSPERRSIRLPKCQLTVTPSQLFEAWRMLNQRESTGLRGGLQASEAGTGKTYVCLAALILRSRIFQLEHEVKKFWSMPPTSSSRRARPATHLPSTALGNGLSCPSQAKGDVLCYCVPTSRARAFIDAGVAPRGCALVQAPFSVVPQWLSIFASANLDPAAYNLIISYPDVPIRLKRNFTQVIQSLSQPGASASNQALETYIFLSSHTNERVFETFTGASSPSIGIQMSDESHFAMNSKSPAMGISEAQSQTGDGLELWLVSATPIRLLEDFELPMQIFCSSSHLARAAAMTELITAYVAAKASNEARQRFLQVWPRVFDSALVLRNTPSSQFNGRPITSLKVATAIRVLLDTPQQHLNAVQEIAYLARDVVREKAKDAARNGEVFKPHYASNVDGRLHFVSLFPGAAGLIQRKELDISPDNVRRLIAAIKVPNKLKVENIAAFQRHLEEISRGSPKLDFIQAEIGRMRADKQQRTPLTGQATLHSEDLAIKKMVIITPTLATAVFLYLWVLKRTPQLNPVCFHTTASSTADRDAALQSFQSLTARKTARHSYILITPFSVGGTGLNLQSANYQIFASPPSSKETETQGFARTNRTGQRLPLHHSILIMQDNPADKINVASYGGRSVIGDPFADVRGDLLLAAPDGSKQIQKLSDWGYRVSNYQFFFELVRDVYGDTIQERQCHGFEIAHPGAYVDCLDRIVYFDDRSVAGNVLAIPEACNGFDPRYPHEKLALRDILLGIWFNELDRPVGGLKSLLYFTVVERLLNEHVRPRIYRMWGRTLNQGLLIRRNSGRALEEESFNIVLEEAPFAIGVQKMLSEYAELSGRAIESFEFLPNIDPDFPDPDPSFDFRITLN